jgi:hypothetical protein
MKTSVTLLFLSLALMSTSVLKAQGFKTPAPGKANVYFVSLKKKSMTFEFFLNDKYIGILGKDNYMVVECNAGKQLLWASSEGKYFVSSDLSTGGSYIIIVETTMGFWRNNPKLVPITSAHPDFNAAALLIKSKPSMVTPQNKIDKMNQDMGQFIPDNLNNYETKLKNEKQFPSITPEMAIPVEALK